MYCINVSIEKRPHFINKGDDVFADDSIQPKIGDLVLHWEQHHGERLKICFYDEKIAETNDTCHVVTQISKHVPSDEEARKERLNRIDWSKTINVDDLGMLSDELKGVTVLVDGLHSAHSQGETLHHKHAYTALNTVIFNIIKNLEEACERVDYMQDALRE